MAADTTPAEPRWAFVTGAAGGIGAAVCRRLAAQGMAVFLTDLDAAPLEDLAARLRDSGARAAWRVADATDAAQVAAAVAEAERLGPIDALVNIAGGSGPTPVRAIEEMDEARWRAVLDLNLTSAFLCCRAVVPGMRARRYGRVVNLSSTVARGRKGPVTTQGARLAYAAAKAALLGFTAQLAKDEAPHGITVNAVMPALILAEQGSRIRARFDALPEEARAAMLRDLPMGRAGEAHEVAAVIGFLCSEAASYVSGVALPVDGAFL
jgi:NAD(P)-dependent dehydrogenase (short-subunit alcohol dehydrogenase family)